jgi:phosphopantetheinyl transferase (holo-ACP synthase)
MSLPSPTPSKGLEHWARNQELAIIGLDIFKIKRMESKIAQVTHSDCSSYRFPHLDEMLHAHTILTKAMANQGEPMVSLPSPTPSKGLEQWAHNQELAIIGLDIFKIKRIESKITQVTHADGFSYRFPHLDEMLDAHAFLTKALENQGELMAEPNDAVTEEIECMISFYEQFCETLPSLKDACLNAIVEFVARNHQNFSSVTVPVFDWITAKVKCEKMFDSILSYFVKKVPANGFSPKIITWSRRMDKAQSIMKADIEIGEALSALKFFGVLDRAAVLMCEWMCAWLSMLLASACAESHLTE